MPAPVRVSIASENYGGFLQDTSGDVDEFGKLADVIVHIPLTKKSLGLLRRKGMVNEDFQVMQNSIATRYKVQGISKMIYKPVIVLEGTAPE